MLSWSRESRFLLLTVIVCAGVLLGLARLRFPDRPMPSAAGPPLERLAARASYDALAGDIRRIKPVIDANLVVVRVDSRTPDSPRTGRDALTTASRVTAVTHLAALRTGADAAMAFMGREIPADRVIDAGTRMPVPVVHRDPVRDWAVLRVPAGSTPSLKRRSLADLPIPTYVIVVEGTQAGTTLRPVFLGQGTRFTSARWARPLLPLGGIAVAPGALLFTLDGEFVGAVTVDGGAPAIVGERDLFEAATRLAGAGAESAGDIGISVQALTPALSKALGSSRGAVVAEVDPSGPSAEALMPGDVVTDLAGHPVDGPDEMLLAVAQRAPGDDVDLALVRAGEVRSAQVTVRPTVVASPVVDAMNFVRMPGTGTRIEPGRQASIAGLLPGDVVTRADTIDAPTPAQLKRVIGAANATGFVPLIVQRSGRVWVVAVPVPAGPQ